MREDSGSSLSANQGQGSPAGWKGANLYGETITFETPGRGLHEITLPLKDAVQRADVETGLCSVFLRHTSASLIITENADPSARRDLECWFERLAPENDPTYTHTAEGPDDMPAHLKSSLLGSSVQIPITEGELNLGLWQGIYLCEHRNHGSSRTLVLTAWGE